MMKKMARDPKAKVRLDPRYASARPWDWRVCRDCQTLVPVQCPRCGSDKLSDKPKDVIHAALAQFGPPPAFFKG